MLILSRKLNESIVIDGKIIVKIVKVDGENIRLGIEAPSSIAVHRQEVYDEIQRTNQTAVTRGRPTLPGRLQKPATAEATPLPEPNPKDQTGRAS
jgi:carbon storage regulator